MTELIICDLKMVICDFPSYFEVSMAVLEITLTKS